MQASMTRERVLRPGRMGGWEVGGPLGRGAKAEAVGSERSASFLVEVAAGGRRVWSSTFSEIASSAEVMASSSRRDPLCAGSPRRGIWRARPMVCSRRDRTSSQSCPSLLIKSSLPIAQTSSSSTYRSPLAQRSLISSHSLLPCIIALERLSFLAGDSPWSFVSSQATLRIPFRIVVNVRLSGAPRPRVGNLAATPSRPSISPAKAQTLRTALVWMVFGFTGEVSVNIE